MQKVEYKLSILILSLPNRLGKIELLLNELNKQVSGKSVQILYLGDNKSMSVGVKRNLLIGISAGRYITFIDDDDMISPTYIDDILTEVEKSPEVISFGVQKYKNGILEKEQRFSPKYPIPYLDPSKKHYNMCPNHLSVWKRDVLEEDFPDKSLGEDHIWAQSMIPHYNHWVNIDKLLYHYYYSSSESETHRR
jgi:hypothetical protein